MLFYMGVASGIIVRDEHKFPFEKGILNRMHGHGGHTGT
jgi:hypothetical protein